MLCDNLNPIYISFQEDTTIKHLEAMRRSSFSVSTDPADALTHGNMSQPIELSSIDVFVASPVIKVVFSIFSSAWLKSKPNKLQSLEHLLSFFSK